jgi:hypothetical protein
MAASEWIGSIGVTLLLIAYFLHLRNILSQENKLYIALNFCGAALACLSSVLIRFYPFVLLEAVWAIVSIIPLFNRRRKQTI